MCVCVCVSTLLLVDVCVSLCVTVHVCEHCPHQSQPIHNSNGMCFSHTSLSMWLTSAVPAYLMAKTWTQECTKDPDSPFFTHLPSGIWKCVCVCYMCETGNLLHVCERMRWGGRRSFSSISVYSTVYTVEACNPPVIHHVMHISPNVALPCCWGMCGLLSNSFWV